MKKVMWIISLIPIVGTALVLQWMPDRVPMHYDMSGTIDRWGSKYEMMIFPVIILALSFFWTLMMWHFEKKASTSIGEKDAAAALSNAKVFGTVGIGMAVMYTALQIYFLYVAYKTAELESSQAAVDWGKVSFIMIGILLIVIGNMMPKTRMNHVIGVRISWSMYNDTTWRKTNRFGGFVLMLTGIFMIIVAAVVSGSYAVTILSMALLMLACVATVIYAHQVYISEKRAEKKEL